MGLKSLKKLLIDLTMWDPKNKRGVGDYCSSIFNHIKRCESKYRIVVILRNSLKEDIKNSSLVNSFQIIYTVFINQPIFEQIILPFYLYSEKPDVLHSPANTGPLIRPKNLKFIVTVHDTVFLSEKNIVKPKSIYSSIGWMYRKLIFPKIIINANEIITVSNFVKNQVQLFLGKKNETSIKTIYHGKNINTSDKNLKTFNHKWLTISGDIEHKNVKNILNLFNKIKTKFPASTLDIVGTRKNNLKLDGVKFHGPIFSRNIINSLYQDCNGYINLSFHESFGLPLVDAMENSSLIIAPYIEGPKEICKNVAIFQSPSDYDYKSILTLLDQPSEIIKLRNKARKRAQNFSWKISVKKHLKLYERALL